MNTQNHPEPRRTGFVLARFGAKFSSVAPFAACIIFILAKQSRSFSEAHTGLLSIIEASLGLFILALPILGLVSGIAALAATKRYGREGIFRWAIFGTL